MTPFTQQRIYNTLYGLGRMGEMRNHIGGGGS